MSEPIVLGIETSCDETAVGIVRGRTLLANVIASSVEEHARFGGVVPEIASRAHALAVQEPYGIWGGLSEDDRLAIIGKDVKTDISHAS